MALLQNMHRILDACRLNEIANDESVRPWLGGKGELDFGPSIQDTANVVLMANEKNGAYFFHRIGDGLYEGHSMFLPSGRGGYAADCLREAMRFMFCATDCTELRTKIPDNNPMAKGMGRAMGFCELFRREKCWPTDAGMVGCSYQSLSLDGWRARDPSIRRHGELFHAQLEDAKAQTGSKLPVHEDDEAHDRAVGVAMLMGQNGNPRKAVWIYNRWAIFAGYAPIVLLSEAPVLIDVMDAIVAPHADGLEIVLCREQPLQPSQP